MSAIEITALSATPEIRAALRDILVETVANGGSVSFMDPLAPAAADAFWDGALAAARRGERIVLGAWDGGLLVGTVTLLLDCPPNQPHRAEIAKMMTRVSHRGRGIATALMRAAEDLAVERNRTLLVLDTATDGGATRLYERLGFALAGEIPDYALKPQGGLTGTLIYWKRIGFSPSPPIVPELGVADLDRSLAVYEEVFGFACQASRPEERFAYLVRGNAHLMLEEVGGPGRRFSTASLEFPFGRGMNLQIEVPDVDALYEQVQQSDLIIHIPLEERWYRQNRTEAGNRQFVVADPDGYLLRFFSSLGTRSA